MTSFLLDSNNNLVYGYTFFEAQDSARITQDIKTKLGLIIGENPFDKEQGFDYIQVMQDFSTQELVNDVKEACKKVDGVEKVNVISTSDKNTFNISIQTTSGEVLNV